MSHLKTTIEIQDNIRRRYLLVDNLRLGEEIERGNKDALKWAKKQLKKRTSVSITNISRLENELAGWRKELSILENATLNIANNNFDII